ncbi:MAG TPA: hypothetical protein VFE59_04970 [Trebonia sp.]|nr:hypothetical protein [Trebonia sp.]
MVNTFASSGRPGAGAPNTSRFTSVPPQPSTRCTVPWLVSKTPLSTVVTGCGRRVFTAAPVATEVPAAGSNPRTGNDRS